MIYKSTILSDFGHYNLGHNCGRYNRDLGHGIHAAAILTATEDVAAKDLVSDIHMVIKTVVAQLLVTEKFCW